jgi:uncharacterized membrane protein YedE/YeeE
MRRERAPRAYADPYAAGCGLGIVVLAAFVVAGRGLGASGAFANSAANLVRVFAPERAAASPTLGRYLQSGGVDWLVVELAGVVIGAFVSAALAGRLRIDIERGPRISRKARLALSFAGGTLMGVGATLARGCTSGLALSGGALLSVGSWLFMVTAFGGGYLAAPLLARAWR